MPTLPLKSDRRHPASSSGRRGLLASLLAVVLLVPVSAQAQAGARGLSDRAVLEAAAAASAAGSATPLTLAGPIDPTRYRVGPGDVFSLAVYGPLYRETRLVVSSEGVLFSPEIGPMPVAGLTLAEVRAQVERRLRTALRGVGIQFQLLTPRTFIIHLTGEVRLRGPLTVTGGSRLSDVLPDSLFTPLASRRMIEVRGLDGVRHVCDLQRFRLTGDDTGDRLLADGDVVQVPVRLESVGAWGAVGRPGEIEFGEADSLGTLLRLAGGLRADAIAERALLTRWTAAHQPESTWVSLASDSPDLRRPLRGGDVLHVAGRSRYHVTDRVEVLGRVERTGSYPIRSGETRLSEVLDAAGGLLADGDSTAVDLYRQRPPGSGADPEFDRLSRLSRGEMTASEYETFHTRLASLYPSFRVNLRPMVRGGINDPVLRDGDVVEVPPTLRTIRVDGQVRRPGLIEYVPGRSWSYYVKQAGGPTSHAARSKVRITRRSSGQTLLARETGAPMPGDFLWVPERSDVSAWFYLKEALVVIAQVATIVIAVRR